MSLKQEFENRLNKIGIDVDPTATIKGKITEYDLTHTNKFNRANSGTFRSEIFIYEGANSDQVIREFMDSSEKSFRADQKLVIKDNLGLFLYANRKFDTPYEFKDEDALFGYLFGTRDSTIKAENIIYFGSPGTGKSYSADIKSGNNDDTKKQYVYKTTFHPEYDYNSFVGGYKPMMNEESSESKIEYRFVPQIFTNAYVKAWNDPKNHYYLQIEEINRGNCAEIFGDLFQLLDRDKDGKSQYTVNASEELKNYLTKNLSEIGMEGIKNNELKLPNNLSIVATMNTSDQSLFPMDSAFKRRWDWEYVSIQYKKEDNGSNFIIELDNGAKYHWLDFLKSINKEILNVTDSQDKQIGNWFINAKNTENTINEKTFINKVMFYLWNDVFKDEENSVFVDLNNTIIESKIMTYEHLFTDNNNSILIEHILQHNLEIQPILNDGEI